MTDTPKQPIPSVDGEVVAWRSCWPDDAKWELHSDPIVALGDDAEDFLQDALVPKPLLDTSRAETATAKRDADTAYDELSAVSKAIGNAQFMDPPDGGSVSLGEQVNRMRLALDAANARADAEREKRIAAESRLAKALRPFAEAASSFDFAIGPDGIDDHLTVLAHAYARPECEVQLSTAHFSDARTALAEISRDEVK